jgi:hypothetical protein
MDLYANRRAIGELSKLYSEVQHEGYKPIEREKESAMYRRAGNLARTSLSSKGKKKEDAQKKSANIVSAITRQKEKERFDRIGQSPSHNEEFVGEAEDREMRKLAAQERAAERKREASRPGRKSITPGKKAVGAGRDYADYQSKSIEAHDKVTKKAKHTVGNPFPEEVQYAEALDPVGKEDADIDNDGDTDKSDKYLHKRRKTIGKAIAKKSGVKESFSDWRQDLSEVLDTEDDKQIKEKKVKNKVVIDPDLKLEAIAHELGAEIVEVIELDEGSLRPGETYMQYAKRKEAEKKDTRMTVTAADKKANTPAYQNYKAGDKRYKAATGVDEEFEIEEDDDEELDEALTGERYKKAVKKPGGTAYSRMVSADPKKRATRGGRGGESDFGAGDRGSGNKAARRAGKTVDEEFEIEEGMTMKDFKVNRQKNKRRESSADAEKRGHVGKEWYNSGRKYSPDEAKRSRAKMDDEERRTRHRSAVDPDNEDDNNYSADRTKNPKKQRKQKAMGEGYLSEKSLSRAQQRFLGMVYAAKKGETSASPEVAKAASGMSKKSAKDFAGTKHKGLPEKKVSKEEFEQIDERRKEDKAAGTPRKPRDRAFEYVAKMMGSNRLGVQPRGKKKEPGKKPPKAGEYGGPVSPAQKVAKRRAAAQRAQDNMSSRYD